MKLTVAVGMLFALLAPATASFDFSFVRHSFFWNIVDRPVVKLVDESLFAETTFDPYLLAEELLKASVGIPACLKAEREDGETCPAECFEELDKLSDVFEEFAQDDFTLVIGRSVSFLAHEAQRLCLDLKDVEWTFLDTPPQFEISALTPLSLAALQCVEAMMESFTLKADFCPSVCPSVFKEAGSLFATYLSPAIGELVSQLGTTSYTLCKEECSECLLVKEPNVSCAIDRAFLEPDTGYCLKGLCVQPRPE